MANHGTRPPQAFGNQPKTGVPQGQVQNWEDLSHILPEGGVQAGFQLRHESGEEPGSGSVHLHGPGGKWLARVAYTGKGTDSPQWVFHIGDQMERQPRVHTPVVNHLARALGHVFQPRGQFQGLLDEAKESEAWHRDLDGAESMLKAEGKKRGGTWAGRSILDPEDAKGLEAEAALREFRDRRPRAEAEEDAHRQYRHGHHQKAAAHHLRGMKMAQASGQTEEAHKHSVMYALHLQQLGHDPYKEPPPEVRALLNKEPDQKQYRYKDHGGDGFLLEKGEELSPGLVLKKAWPRDEAENQANAAAHQVMEDAVLEQGYQRREVPLQEVKDDLDRKQLYGFHVPAGTEDPAFAAARMGEAADFNRATGGAEWVGRIGGGMERAPVGPHSPSYWPQSSNQGGSRHEVSFWSRLGRSAGLKKAWPKNDQENEANASTHQVIEDSMLERGAEKKVVTAKETRAKLIEGHRNIGGPDQNTALSHNEGQIRAGQARSANLGRPARWPYADEGPHEPLQSTWQENINTELDGVSKKSAAAEKKFWGAIGKAVGLKKGWPKDDQENSGNAASHQVMEDAILEQGGKKEVAGDKLHTAAGQRVLGAVKDAVHPSFWIPKDEGLQTPDPRNPSRTLAGRLVAQEQAFDANSPGARDEIQSVGEGLGDQPAAAGPPTSPNIGRGEDLTAEKKFWGAIGKAAKLQKAWPKNDAENDANRAGFIRESPPTEDRLMEQGLSTKKVHTTSTANHGQDGWAEPAAAISPFAYFSSQQQSYHPQLGYTPKERLGAWPNQATTDARDSNLGHGDRFPRGVSPEVRRGRFQTTQYDLANPQDEDEYPWRAGSLGVQDRSQGTRNDRFWHMVGSVSDAMAKQKRMPKMGIPTPVKKQEDRTGVVAAPKAPEPTKTAMSVHQPGEGLSSTRLSAATMAGPNPGGPKPGLPKITPQKPGPGGLVPPPAPAGGPAPVKPHHLDLGPGLPEGRMFQIKAPAIKPVLPENHPRWNTWKSEGPWKSLMKALNLDPEDYEALGYVQQSHHDLETQAQEKQGFRNWMRKPGFNSKPPGPPKTQTPEQRRAQMRSAEQRYEAANRESRNKAAAAKRHAAGATPRSPLPKMSPEERQAHDRRMAQARKQRWMEKQKQAQLGKGEPVWKSLLKAWPKDDKENQDNARGFLNQPPAMDGAQEQGWKVDEELDSESLKPKIGHYLNERVQMGEDGPDQAQMGRIYTAADHNALQDEVARERNVNERFYDGEGYVPEPASPYAQAEVPWGHDPSGPQANPEFHRYGDRAFWHRLGRAVGLNSGPMRKAWPQKIAPKDKGGTHPMRDPNAAATHQVLQDSIQERGDVKEVHPKSMHARVAQEFRDEGHLAGYDVGTAGGDLPLDRPPTTAEAQEVGDWGDEWDELPGDDLVQWRMNDYADNAAPDGAEDLAARTGVEGLGAKARPGQIRRGSNSRYPRLTGSGLEHYSQGTWDALEEHSFWSGLRGELKKVRARKPVKKAWPKDEKENSANAASHQIMEDAILEQGGKRREPDPEGISDSLKSKHEALWMGSAQLPEKEPWTQARQVAPWQARDQGLAAAQDFNREMDAERDPEVLEMEMWAPGRLQPADLSLAHRPFRPARAYPNRPMPADADPRPTVDEFAEQRFWSRLGRLVGLNKALKKALPRTQKENKANADANAVVQDHLMEQGRVMAEPGQLASITRPGDLGEGVARELSTGGYPVGPHLGREDVRPPTSDRDASGGWQRKDDSSIARRMEHEYWGEVDSAAAAALPPQFKPGDQVTHINQDGYPGWVGTIRPHNVDQDWEDDEGQLHPHHPNGPSWYENGVDGPGHYYEVRWRAPNGAVHADFLHQDLLRPVGGQKPHKLLKP